jgi:hypothetical protein
VSDPHRANITAAEVLAVSGGADDATGQPVVVISLRPITGSGWGHVNFALGVENARSLLDRLTTAFTTSPYLVNGGSGTTA